jgi:hypothetical protein
VRIAERSRDQGMARKPHALESNLRLRDSTRYMGKRTIDSGIRIDRGIHPFGAVLIGLVARPRAAKLPCQSVDFDRCDRIAKYRKRQAMAARIL